MHGLDCADSGRFVVVRMLGIGRGRRDHGLLGMYSVCIVLYVFDRYYTLYMRRRSRYMYMLHSTPAYCTPSPGPCNQAHTVHVLHTVSCDGKKKSDRMKDGT